MSKYMLKAIYQNKKGFDKEYFIVCFDNIEELDEVIKNFRYRKNEDFIILEISDEVAKKL